MYDTMFDYLNPTDQQIATMADVRQRYTVLAQALGAALPDGPDKTHILRLIRTAAMWSNVAIMRHQDGSPRE